MMYLLLFVRLHRMIGFAIGFAFWILDFDIMPVYAFLQLNSIMFLKYFYYYCEALMCECEENSKKKEPLMGNFVEKWSSNK